MLIDELKINSTVVVGLEGSEDDFSFNSKVLEVLPGEIRVSTSFEAVVRLLNDGNLTLTVRYTHGGKMLYWDIESWSEGKDGIVRYLSFFSSKESKSFNRRNVFRIPCDYSANLTGGELSTSILLKDISYEGVGIVCTEPLKLHSTVEVKVQLVGSSHTLVGMIVRNAKGSNEYGIKLLRDYPEWRKAVAAKQMEAIRQKRAM